MVQKISFGKYVLKRVIIVLFLAAGFFFFLYNAAAFQLVNQSTSLTHLIRSAATETLPHCTEKKIWLDVTPQDSNPIVMQIFSEVFLNAGKFVSKVSLSDNQKVAVDVRELQKTIIPLHDSSYQRFESINIGVTIENSSDKSVVWSHEFSNTASDTLNIAEYMQLQNQNSPQSHSFIESLLEPILVTTTAIVIIVLLFTVRGS